MLAWSRRIDVGEVGQTIASHGPLFPRTAYVIRSCEAESLYGMGMHWLICWMNHNKDLMHAFSHLIKDENCQLSA